MGDDELEDYELHNNVNKSKYPYLYQRIDYLINNNPDKAFSSLMNIALQSIIDESGETHQRLEDKIKAKYGDVSPEDYKIMLELGIAEL